VRGVARGDQQAGVDQQVGVQVQGVDHMKAVRGVGG
jgi:hypothetical protein